MVSLALNILLLRRPLPSTPQRTYLHHHPSQPPRHQVEMSEVSNHSALYVPNVQCSFQWFHVATRHCLARRAFGHGRWRSWDWLHAASASHLGTDSAPSLVIDGGTDQNVCIKQWCSDIHESFAHHITTSVFQNSCFTYCIVHVHMHRSCMYVYNVSVLHDNVIVWW